MSRKPPADPEEASPQLSLESRFVVPPAPRLVREEGAGEPAPPPRLREAEPSGEAADAAPAETKPAEPRVYAVGELIRAARITLESRFADVRVEGEISGLKRSGPGHLYFCLKDEEAQLDCVLFSREAARLKFSLEEGMAVRCRGRLTLYEARGRFQMTVVAVEPTGAGALALAFEQLKRRLGAEGLFDPARKRRLPFLPRRIGVVSSASGAVIRDIIRVAHRRFPIPILLSPTPVQGEGASLAIAAALRRLETVPDVDVIIVARGGGSLEDLWAFNEEPVARAIHACRVPVISAVGHETDFTIADFVADLRAPTPSAAAELAVPIRDELVSELALLRRRSARALSERLRRARHELERARGRIGDPRRIFDEGRLRLDEQLERGRRVLGRRLAAARAELRGADIRLHRAHPQRRVLERRGTLAALRHRLENAIRPGLSRRRHAVQATAGKLEALSPTKVLERGFSLAQRPDGHVVTSATEVRPGERLDLRLRDGTVTTTVDGSATRSTRGK